MLRTLFKLARKPEHRTLYEIDSYLKYLGKNLENELFENLVGDGVMNSDIIISIPVEFNKTTWQTLVEEEMHTEPVYLDLESTKPHSIHYFSGFNDKKGYKILINICDKFGLNTDLFYDPLDDHQTARIGVVIWSKDNRPLRSCLQNPTPLPEPTKQ